MYRNVMIKMSCDQNGQTKKSCSVWPHSCYDG